MKKVSVAMYSYALVGWPLLMLFYVQWSWRRSKRMNKLYAELHSANNTPDKSISES